MGNSNSEELQQKNFIFYEELEISGLVEKAIIYQE
jgi:hypothetical protein